MILHQGEVFATPCGQLFVRAGFYDLPFVQDHDLVGVADAVVAERARKSQNRFLSQVDKLIDWDKVRKVIEKKYKKRENAVGGKAYDCVLLFKILLLETWYNLSDPAVEERINDSITFSRFLWVCRWKRPARIIRRSAVSGRS